MENPFAEQLKDLPSQNTRKLTFEEQCAFFVALKLKVPPLAVASAAGVSHIAVSHLARAGSFLGGQVRYPRVAREYAARGHEDFVHKYLTPVMRDRLAVAIDEHKRREREPALNDKGFNPLANRYCGRHEWPETSIGLHAIFSIELAGDRGGFMWRNLKPFQGQPEVPADQVSYNPATQLQGDPARNGKGFARSDLCYRHVKHLLNPSRAQLAENNA